MLTQEDLQQLRQMLDERDDRLEEKLEKKFNEKLSPIHKDIKAMKKELSYVKKTVNILVRRTDEADVYLQLRMNRVETVLNLPPLKHTEH